MLRATSIVRRPAVRDERIADEITLDHQARHRRRFALTADGGLAFLLDLDAAAILDDGDAVKLEDGRLVRIKAAPEALVEVATPSPLRLMKVAWHLGNRHVPTEITADALYFAQDHVLEEMVRGLGVEARRVTRPFRPEKGAYAGHGAGDGGHDGHAHDHHGHAHGHEAHRHEALPGAVEGCGCGHDHDHPGHAGAGDHHPHAADPASGGHVHGPGCGHHGHDRRS